MEESSYKLAAKHDGGSPGKVNRYLSANADGSLTGTTAESLMRGQQDGQARLVFAPPSDFVPEHHPIRTIRLADRHSLRGPEGMPIRRTAACRDLDC